jgi:hypothetical protein
MGVHSSLENRKYSRVDEYMHVSEERAAFIFRGEVENFFPSTNVQVFLVEQSILRPKKHFHS